MIRILVCNFQRKICIQIFFPVKYTKKEIYGKYIYHQDFTNFLILLYAEYNKFFEVLFSRNVVYPIHFY